MMNVLVDDFQYECVKYECLVRSCVYAASINKGMDCSIPVHLELFDHLALLRCCKVLSSCGAAFIADGGNARVIDCLISGAVM